mgnify:CR=1 FL=1
MVAHLAAPWECRGWLSRSVPLTHTLPPSSVDPLSHSAEFGPPPLHPSFGARYRNWQSSAIASPQTPNESRERKKGDIYSVIDKWVLHLFLLFSFKTGCHIDITSIKTTLKSIEGVILRWSWLIEESLYPVLWLRCTNHIWKFFPSTFHLLALLENFVLYTIVEELFSKKGGTLSNRNIIFVVM